ncbi:hypothetical protein GLE_4021 [Lysobacter enzymogenes]|uniref:Uncharacterized protein n=1 Tax=Lysobacter enzymogenes TaxID=69 RepID=A0A0S2DLH0_LYSEN|nr:hypothetical protein [Lysobacter enzymogenes]ALN59363.1 hypothetical protein GLE_4021 [Lysobacter enzymogenes]
MVGYAALPFQLLQMGAQPTRRTDNQRGPMTLEVEDALGVDSVPGLAELEGVE